MSSFAETALPPSSTSKRSTPKKSAPETDESIFALERDVENAAAAALAMTEQADAASRQPLAGVLGRQSELPSFSHQRSSVSMPFNTATFPVSSIGNAFCWTNAVVRCVSSVEPTELQR